MRLPIVTEGRSPRLNYLCVFTFFLSLNIFTHYYACISALMAVLNESYEVHYGTIFSFQLHLLISFPVIFFVPIETFLLKQRRTERTNGELWKAVSPCINFSNIFLRRNKDSSLSWILEPKES